MNREDLKGYGIPTKETVDYGRVYSYDLRQFDYTQFFKEYELNRGGNMKRVNSHIQKMTSDIIHSGTKYFDPVRVDINTLTIIDGNCRMRAFRNVFNILSNTPDVQVDVILNVIYIDAPEHQIKEAIQGIQNNKSWSQIDFFNLNCLDNNENYKRFLKFCDEIGYVNKRTNEPNLRYAGALFGFPHSVFKNGNLKFTESDYEEGVRRAREVGELLSTIVPDIDNGRGYGWMEAFIKGYVEFMKEYDKGVFNDFDKFMKSIRYVLEKKKKLCPAPYGATKFGLWLSFFDRAATFRA